MGYLLIFFDILFLVCRLHNFQSIHVIDMKKH